MVLHCRAARVLQDRLLESDVAWDMLLKDLASKNGSRRGKALSLIDLLSKWNDLCVTPPISSDLFF